MVDIFENSISISPRLPFIGIICIDYPKKGERYMYTHIYIEIKMEIQHSQEIDVIEELISTLITR